MKKYNREITKNEIIDFWKSIAESDAKIYSFPFPLKENRLKKALNKLSAAFRMFSNTVNGCNKSFIALAKEYRKAHPPGEEGVTDPQ